MQKKNNLLPVIIGAIIIIILLIGAFFLFKGKEDTGTVNDVKKRGFEIESENLDSYKYMKKMGDYNLFYLGLDTVTTDGIDLLTFIDENDIKDLKKNFNKVETYKDGGSEVYTCDDENKCDLDIKILFCNTLAGDKDVYVAHKDVNLTADYCDNNTSTEPEE